MEVVHPSAGTVALPDGCVATIGAFDGVHLGHRQVIAQVRRRAAERGVASAVVTFDRHPASVVRPESAPGLLTDLDQKLDLLAETGVDYAAVVTFDSERAHESAEDFVSSVLVGSLRVWAVIVGADFHFGYRRAGNVALLEKLGAADPPRSAGGTGFEVLGLDLFDEAGRSGTKAVSSTRVRKCLGEGDVAGAAALLGRFHQVRGVAEAGSVAVPAGIVLPAAGAYAGLYAGPDGRRRPAVLEVAEGGSPVEVALLDAEGHLVGGEARVSFVGRLRGPSVEESAGQRSIDAEQARLLLPPDAG